MYKDIYIYYICIIYYILYYILYYVYIYCMMSRCQELYRFLLGRTPSTDQLEVEWDRLVSGTENEFADQRMCAVWGLNGS